MKYTESHEWVDLEKDIAVVGITEFAQKELGEVVFIELPKIGEKLKAGDEAAILESTKAAVDIYAPISGEIVEVNSSLKQDPSLINRAPQKEGWLFKVRPTHPHEIQDLLDEKAYLDMIG